MNADEFDRAYCLFLTKRLEGHDRLDLFKTYFPIDLEAERVELLAYTDYIVTVYPKIAQSIANEDGEYYESFMFGYDAWKVRARLELAILHKTQ